jgi:hypothetical protein
MKLTRTLTLTALCSALIFSSTALASAAEPAQMSRAEQASKLAEEASELYKAHDYSKANEKYAQAYVLDPDPNLLYNQARCYEGLGDRPLTDAKYKEFLGKPGGDVTARKRAQAFVDDFAKNPSGVTASPNKPAQGTSVTSPTTGGANTTPGSDPPEPSSMGGLRIAGLVAAGVGVVGLGIGTVTGLNASSKNNEAEKQCTGKQCPQSALDLTSSAKSAATVSTVSFVVGGVLLAGGLSLFLFGPKGSSKRAQLTPTVSPTFAGASLTGGF